MLDGKLSSDEAARLFYSDFWMTWTLAQRAGFWLYQTYACLPLEEARAALTECLGREVNLYEFGDFAKLRAEFESLGFAEFKLDDMLATLSSEQLAALQLEG